MEVRSKGEVLREGGEKTTLSDTLCPFRLGPFKEAGGT